MDKVLVANRGEIAVRVLRACRELGITAVAVYSDADRDALHVALADEAWHIGEAAPAKSYLNIDKLVDVARRAHADAIHPGYGFLAENAAFAQAVLDAGIAWVGPKPAAIAIMGDKVAARRVAEQAKAPLVPGTGEPISGAAEAVAFGAKHGWPLALKAAFGGGGRGMKVVADAAKVEEALASAQRESKAAFGRDEIYVERYLDAPRHVEAQILADGRGEVVFVGERDCSLQRRHQKLVEEAPAPGLPEEVRAALGKAACDIARAADYANAGTIEFLYEPKTANFYFLEMNTRLQVEHPVTEMTAGVDLVHAQLRIAAGEAIPSHYDVAVAPRGHAIEVRINAEDPGQRFMPAPGPVTAWYEPSGPGVRVDAGVRAGFTIPEAYDSLLAKLIVWGEDREQARRRMLRALAEFTIRGVPTTIPFHQLAMRDPAFIAGDVSTVLVEQGMDLSALKPQEPIEREQTAKPPPRRLVIELEDKRFDVQVLPQEEIRLPERRRTPRSPKALARARAEMGGPGKEIVKTPMQGTIVKVLVADGDTVSPGQTIVVLEAMKMENHVTAHQAGTISGITVGEGQSVPTGATIATITAS